jgi:hypothetical protein
MIDSDNAREARRQFPLALVAGVVIVFVVFGAVALMSKSVHVAAPAPQAPMAFGAAEQAYAAHIHYSDIKLAKSSNLLNQQFTYINGTVTNDGDRTVNRLAMTVTFNDDLANKEAVLTDTETIIGESATDQPLPPHQQRAFSVTIEKYPETWNQQDPVFKTTGLVLQ